MLKLISSISVLSFFTLKVFSQTIDVAESTLKISGLGEEVFYYGFAEGDQLIFNFEEVNGKELKEIEIIELPSSSKFMDYKTKKIENKTLNITKTGIYKFRFANSAIMGRICKFKIQRVASNESPKNFNTNVYWKTIYDSTYSVEQERFLVKSDTSILNITDQVAKVHSVSNANGNRTTLNFLLPDNTIAWSYYIGVDQNGQQAYANASEQLSKNASPLISKIPGYGPLAALALGSVSYLTALQAGEDIDFYIFDTDNKNLYSQGLAFRYFKKGKVINDYSRMTFPLKGMLNICLINDNAITGVQVTVKVTAIQVNEIWDTRPVQKLHVASRQEAYLKN